MKNNVTNYSVNISGFLCDYFFFRNYSWIFDKNIFYFFSYLIMIKFFNILILNNV